MNITIVLSGEGLPLKAFASAKRAEVFCKELRTTSHVDVIQLDEEVDPADQLGPPAKIVVALSARISREFVQELGFMVELNDQADIVASSMADKVKDLFGKENAEVTVGGWQVYDSNDGVLGSGY